MITRRKLFSMFPAALAGGALWTDALAQSPAVKRVVILGDSITAGFGLQRSEAYPALLQAKVNAEGLPFEIVGAGVSGDTTAGGLRRVGWAIGSGAAVFVVALGGNDGLRGVPVAQTEDNLERIVAAVRAKSPETAVLIAGMRMPANLGKDFQEAFAAVFPRVATKCKAALIPFLLEGVGGRSDLNQGDLIHPNAEGQRRVAENVWKVLAPVLRGRS